MQGKNVAVFLKTPLFRFRYLIGKQERQLLENVVRVEGKVVDEKTAGIMIKVKVLSNLKQKETKLPFETIFLPFDKVDFIIFL